MPQSYADQQISVGTPAFFSALLAHIEDATYGQGLPIDTVVLQSILLCFIAGDKHLLLRTSSEDVPLVSRIVTTILTSLFGLRTHKLRIRRGESKPLFDQVNTSSFLRSVFLPGAIPSSTSSLDQLIQHKSEKRRSGSRSTKRRSQRYSRSSSYPNDLQAVSPSSIRADAFDEKTIVNGTLSSNPFSSSHAVYPTLPHSHSEPVPISDSSESPRLGPVPNAVVLSGLENASLPSQRALTRVLLDKRLIFDSHERGRSTTGSGDLDGVWNLPDNFFLVYVCPLDTRERPAIHKTLLDQFAMSAAVTLTSDIRALAKHPHSQVSLPSVPVIPETYLPCLRRAYKRTHFPGQLSLYLADIFSAARHHPSVDGTFLTARAIADARDLARAARVLGGDPTGMQLIQDAAAFQDSLSLATTETGVTDTEADKFFDVMDGIGEGSVMMVNIPSLEEDGEVEPKILDVSEADIARIAPRVMSHRLRVRNSDDGVFRGSLTGVTMPLERERERTTVKDVLVQVLAEV